MRRRDFVKVAAIAVPAAVLPTPNTASAKSTDWALVDHTNPFGQKDTVYERLEKFNRLTGAGVSFGYVDTTGQYIRHDKFYGAETCGRTNLVFPDGRGTGYMNKEEFMHWTAEVGLGYRLAKAQGL